MRVDIVFLIHYNETYVLFLPAFKNHLKKVLFELFNVLIVVV